jgi:ABC-2 type transport system permease protein
MTPRRQLEAALAVEWLKFRSSPVPVVATVLLVLGIVAVSVATMLAPGGEGAFAQKAAVMATARDWDTLFMIAGQVAAVGGLITFGVVSGWIYGREFTDGTVFGLHALPVSLSAVAVAKLVMLLGWAVALGPALTASLLLTGWGLGLDASASSVAALSARLVLTTVLTALLALPCAVVATRTRGYLAAIGAVIATVVVAQVAVTAGLGGWFPFAAPGVWATSPSPSVDSTLAVQLLLVIPVGALAALVTTRAWRRLSL